MGTLPSLSKTWRFQVNAATAAGGSGLAACQNLMWAIKEALIGNGAWTDSTGAGAASSGNWTVVSSSDSVTADGTDRWAAATNLIWAAAGVAHSWIVLKQTGIGANFQILIDLVNATPSNAYIAVSPSAGFTGGTIQNAPTATDEVRLLSTSTWGGINAATASTLHVLRSTTGACNRVLICRGGFNVGYWCIDALASAEPAGWTVPFMAMVSGNAASAASQSVYATIGAAGTSAIGYSYRNGYIATCTIGSEYSRQFGYMGQQTVANDIGASWYIGDMFVYSETPNNKGYLGKMFDQWWTSATLADSDTFPVAGPTRNFCVFGDTVQPWDTSAPVFGGGASTARDGDYMETPYYQDLFLASSFASPYGSGTPEVVLPSVSSITHYRMRALDDNDGTTWISWTSVGSADYAGSGFATGSPTPVGSMVAGSVVVTSQKTI